MMSGHVFHPGHSELHGITVVVETTGDALFVGRYHEETVAGVLLHDVAELQAAGDAATREEFLRKTFKFGVHAQHGHKVIPTLEVRRISRLVEWDKG